MFTAKVNNKRGNSLVLFPSMDYAVTISGLTPGKASLNFSTVGTNDGSLHNSGRKENRNIVMEIRPLRNIEENRIALYKVFQLKKTVEFYFRNGSRNVFIEGYVESLDGDLFEQGETLQVSIICNKPNFKALEETITDISQVVPLFSFPFSISKTGIAFSTIEKLSEKNVYNSGDAESGLIIELRAIGAVSDPVIYDEAGNAFGIKITMADGDKITINTNKGEKSVTLLKDGTESNIINKVMANPYWFTLEPGDNVFMYSATNGDLLQIIFKHFDQFEGV